ncbi:GyrI-like domain-containing protein [Clostridium nigeriense]|uniref:GyrI-like domain-containing protein n=1 Tax=Clostridium nigeriense TaxID=1805470 RepID=UPI0008376326
MNYKIEEFPAFKVMGVSQKIKTSDAFNTIPSIWDKAWKNGTMEKFLNNFPNYRPSGFLGIAQGGQWGESEFMEYIIGVTNYIDSLEYKEFPLIDGMEEFSYPSAKWVIINANGELPEAIQKVYKEFYSEWLPNSKYKLANLPVIECYMENKEQEVWIAITN